MNIIHKLFELGAIKFGSFTLKSGLVSPIYVDLRMTISNPKLLVSIAEAMYAAVKECSFDLICGVPYAALPFATAISIHHNIPMILCRKEKKEYGTKKLIEGIYEKGQTCLIVEDVITAGASIFETIDPLKAEGIEVKDLVIFVDREQGGRKKLEDKGYNVHAVCTISSIVEELQKEGHINKAVADSVLTFIKNNQAYD